MSESPFDFGALLNLPLIWGGLIAVAVLLYVILDGFDLGIGILFPFAPSRACRATMMNSIAPFWDGNETWLVLGGAGLLAAFPLAYSILMPAFYLPIILMLLGLILRGVAFEFRFKSKGTAFQPIWDCAFHFGSLIATFFQGIILGTFVQGIRVEGHRFAGTDLDWISPFSFMTGVALPFGYALLGSTWLHFKTTGQTQAWARRTSCYAGIYVLLFIGLVSLWVPFINPHISARWFKWPNIAYLAPVPLTTLTTGITLFKSLYDGEERLPFLCSILLFILAYLGLGISLWPWIVPYSITLEEAAASSPSLSLLLIGAAIFLPVILGYTSYCYYVFRGKTGENEYYSE